MLKKSALTTLFIFAVLASNARQPVDSVQMLRPVTIQGYFGSQPALTLPSSVSVITRNDLQAQQPYSMVPALNAVPGVRMEERSPGSYRLSIRGSLLRSPFGIRNVKIYMDDFILTDAGGNTYLGSVDAEGVGGLEILKGPEASVFGANTGGVMLIHTKTGSRDSSHIRAGITGGAYGLLYQKASLYQKRKNGDISISEAWQRSDGYRDNSAMRRNYIHVAPSLSYSAGARLKALILYSDMDYRTPGGLTESQLKENPRAARPATAVTPGAEEQKAGIRNRTLLTGLGHELRFNDRLRNVTAVTYSNTAFKNPFITNYEVRNENSIGLRTYFELTSREASVRPWKIQLGYEGQHSGADISNYGNRRGLRDTIQAADDLSTNQKFFFIHMSANLSPALLMEIAGSYNFYNYRYSNIAPVASGPYRRTFDNEMMPRIAFSYLLHPDVAIRVSASRGYSPPTIAEVRASDNVINTSLDAESGWQYEAGIRLSLFHNRVYWDGVVFNFNLNDAIVRRLSQSGNEFFQTAGRTRQNGFESQFLAWLIPPRETGFFRALRFSNSYTLSAFYFRDYISGEDNFSGNRLTGVPRHMVVTSMNFRFPAGLSLNSQHSYSSRAPLNDAGTVYSGEYHLVQLKAEWSQKRMKSAFFSAFLGLDNILSQNYSLGNDLNAFGGRYFNPAPVANFFAGINVNF
ncbi:TonB-dependent receptor [Pararcticibacter amylolyticus]|uniref:TonB-dependent receptor n=1 Tax=Pararcticibacter amylolyticus TaxID=2173175 RepID=A0A2U2PB90_9SPHI|nr:TonB-dependent receptor [Pararcticibacter amylolyticus]PWG78666.1 TonB-dependent receptor [Pararcticibacter amylolyticus]